MAGRNNRLILANTEELHDEIERLRTRLREVEDESKSLRQRLEQQQGHSPPSIDTAASTPALSSGSSSNNAQSPGTGKTEEENLVDAFGTLTVGPRGETKFYGPTARSEFLAYAVYRRIPPMACSSKLTQDLLDAASATPSRFPSTVAMNDNIKQKLEAALPSLTEAYKLCNSFLEAGKYMYYPLPRKEVFDELLPNIYGSSNPTQDVPDSLPLLFIIFAFGILGDLSKPLVLHQANEFYMLARVALNLKSTLRDTTLLWVQALIYMVQYVDIVELEGTSMPWIDIGIAVKYAYSIGLNLKGSRWGLDPDTAMRRNRTFWHLFKLDTYISFGFGRPPSISLEFVECDFPPDIPEVTDENGTQEIGYHTWALKYALFLRSTIMPVALCGKVPTYSTILDLDRRIREYPVPVYLRPSCASFRSTDPMHFFMARGAVLYRKEITLLYLHRGYFAQALQEKPEDPLRHRFGTSVMAAYRSAYRLIIGLRDLFDLIPDPMTRITIPWSYTVSATIVMCLLVTKARVASLTKSALEHLDIAHILFGRVAALNSAFDHMREMMNKMHHLAHAAANRMYFQRAVIAELDRLGGKTRFLSGNDVFCHQTIVTGLVAESGTPEVPLEHVSPPGSDVPSDASLMLNIPENVHPTITQDLMNFECLTGSTPYEFSRELYDQPVEEASTAPIGPPATDFGDGWHFGTIGGDSQPHLEFHLASQLQPSSNVLDSTWQDFVQQLGTNDLL